MSTSLVNQTRRSKNRDWKEDESAPWLSAPQRSNGAKSKIWPVVIILASSLVLGLPFLLYGPLLNGYDTYEHLNYSRHFAEQFWQGDLYPRWLIDMNKGLGSPSYFVYPPLHAYVFALLKPIANVLKLNAFNIAAWLPLAGSGISAFLWLRTSFEERVATTCAVIYMAMPYHLGIDFYRRCAISENWAFVWMPLLLYFADRIISGKGWALIGWAVTLALFICSHPNSALLFFWIPVCIALVNPGSGQRMKLTARLGLACVLGFCLSAAYLLPALTNAKYMPVSRLMSGNPGYLLSNQLVFVGRRLMVHPGREFFLQWISWTVVCLAFVVVLAGIAALRWEAQGVKSRTLFWVTICGLLVFMMSKYSEPIWAHMPILHETIQYPWRLSGPLCVGATAILGSFFSRVYWRSWSHRLVFSAVFIVLACPILFAYGNEWWHYKTDAVPPPLDNGQFVNEHDGWIHTWIAPGTSQQASLSASLGPKVRFREGEGSANASQWEPRRIELEVNSARGGWVMINQFYYPTWHAESISDHRQLPVRPAMPEGLLEVQVSPGTERVQVALPVSPSEWLGRWLSLFGLLVCFVGMFNGTPRKWFRARFGTDRRQVAVLSEV